MGRSRRAGRASVGPEPGEGKLKESVPKSKPGG